MRASVTFREPSQSILSALITLLEFVIPIRITSYYNVFTVEGTAASRVFFRIVA